MIRAPCSKSRILPAFRIFRVIRVAHLAYFRRFESFESFELHISRFSRESIISQQRRRENTPDYLALTESVGETLTYMDFPTEHWSRIRTNNLTERVNREIRRRTRAIGAFPDGNSALMLVCARLRHVAASEWDSKRYMDMEHLFKMEIEQPADEENPYI